MSRLQRGLAVCALLCALGCMGNATFAQTRTLPARTAGEAVDPTGAPGSSPPSTPGTAPRPGVPARTQPPSQPPRPPTVQRLPARPVPSATAPALPGNSATPYAQAEVLVIWRDAERFAADRLRLADVSQFEQEYLNLTALGWQLLRYRFDSEQAALLFRERLLRDFPAAESERNWHYTTLGKPRLYAGTRVGAPAATWAQPLTGRIGLLDTAIRSVPALAHSQIERRSFIGKAMPANDAHGTAVATALAGRDDAAAYRAPGWGVVLLAGEIMRSEGTRVTTSTAMLLAGLDWLLASRVSVVNLSLGGPGDALLRSAVQTLIERGLVVVAAAGNGGPEAAPVFPAAYPGVIAVTAVDAALAPYANAPRGRHVLVAAPGVEVWLPDAGPGAYHSGSSYAAPLVAATLARRLAARQMSPAAAADWLCRSALDLGETGRDDWSGCGLLQWPGLP